jgi:hypothetical protein
MKAIITSVAMSLLFFVLPISAGEADVIDVVVKQNRDGTYSFDVTVAHADSGWDHYANRWEIVDTQGNILATRTLHHPHVNEQPFTRSLSAVRIDESVKSVIFRVHDSVHEYGGKNYQVALPK